MDDSRQLLPILNDVESNFSETVLSELAPVLTSAKSVKQDGNRITIEREAATHVPLNGEYLNKNVQVTSLNFGNSVSFDYDRNSRTISNINGLSLNLSFFGKDRAVAVRTVSVEDGANGHKTLNAQFENPLPAPAQRIVGMPNVINIKIEHDGGGFVTPNASEVFAKASSLTGPSIAGLLAADTFTEASKVALFAESNPKWIKDVVDPALRQIYDKLYADTAPAADAAPPTQVRVESKSTVVTPRDANALAPRNQAGGKADVTKPGDYVFSTSIDGAEREYRVHVPPTYDPKKAMPLVLLLHGHAQDGAEIARHTKLNALADREGFIAVYPDATPWAGRREWRAWDTDNGLLPPGSNTDDVAFLRHVIESAEKNYTIDPKRIYMGGMSNGGMMTYRAAGELSDKLAAIAVISGAMSGIEPSIKSPLSVMHIHGTNDPIVPYDGLKNVPESLRVIGLPKFKPLSYASSYWAEQNQITGAPVVTKGNQVTERRFKNKANGAEVVERTIHGGDHVPDDIDGVVNNIWQFFKDHPKVNGQVSGTLQPRAEQPFNISERLKAHVNNRGVQGLEIDTGDMLNEVEHINDGSFSPASGLAYLEKRTGIEIDDEIGKFLKSTNRITKAGNRIEIDLDKPQEIPIGRGAGRLELSSLRMDDASFDLTKVNGRPWLKNIEGINFNVKAMGRDLSVDVKELGQKIDGNGAPYYHLRTENPLPGWARTALFAKSQIPIELRMNQSGSPTILNESQIKDATLGVNPVTRGYLDIGTHASEMVNDPSWGSGLHLAKDVAIVGGTGFGAYRLAALKMATKGRVGVAAAAVTLIAPSLIHGIERMID